MGRWFLEGERLARRFVIDGRTMLLRSRRAPDCGTEAVNKAGRCETIIIIISRPIVESAEVLGIIAVKVGIFSAARGFRLAYAGTANGELV